MTFENLGLRPEILRALDEIDYREPTPIQTKAIPLVLEGQDLMACAQTGTGKTAAFALPILQRLAESERQSLRALVLVPTRELAIQVAKNINAYATHLNVTTTCAYGGVPIEPQEMMLRHGVDILVATPGRLIDHMWRGNIDYRHTEVLVLDEADRMLDMGFIKDVLEIVREIPQDRQSMLFSATLGPDITRLAREILRDPVRIEVAPPASTVDKVQQFILKVNREDKAEILEDLIRKHDMRRSIVFSKTKVGAARLASHLRRRGIRAEAIHSNRSQEERVRTLEAFRSGDVHVLVATDIAARGIDVDEITHVVNYDVPYAAEDYVHRIGRTARAGRTGMAIMLVTREEVRGLHAIERLIGFKLPEEGGALVPLGEGVRAGRSPRAARDPGDRGERPRSGRARRDRRTGRGGSVEGAPRAPGAETIAAGSADTGRPTTSARRRSRRRRGRSGTEGGAAPIAADSIRRPAPAPVDSTKRSAPRTRAARDRRDEPEAKPTKRSALRSMLEKLGIARGGS